MSSAHPNDTSNASVSSLRQRIYTIIFEADTVAGRFFDLVLIFLILLSVVLVMLDSVPGIHEDIGDWLIAGEMLITVLFTIEYILRLYSARRPGRYAFSFFGLVDLLTILPGYASLIFPGLHFLATIRIVRVLRIFRILKLVQFIGEGSNLWQALVRSRHKITVFITTIITIVVFVGSLMYLIEGEKSGFTSIPKSIYWAVVTLTTVGYGDLAPRTDLGQAVAALVMLLGYGILAVPTGIFTAELASAMRTDQIDAPCPSCDRKRHESGAVYCASCGHALE